MARKQSVQQLAPPVVPLKPQLRIAPVTKGSPRVGEIEVRTRAFEKWEAAGRPMGDGVQFWLEAEKELLQANSG